MLGTRATIKGLRIERSMYLTMLKKNAPLVKQNLDLHLALRDLLELHDHTGNWTVPQVLRLNAIRKLVEA